MKVAVYPGSFDPITMGHMDIISRSSKFFEKIIVAIGHNHNKAKGMFPVEKRLEMIKLATKNMDNVEVHIYDGLLIDFAEKVGANIIIKGVRNSKDFEYEQNMALINNSLKEGVETFLLVADPKYCFISSSMIRELMYFKKDVTEYVPNEIMHMLKT